MVHFSLEAFSDYSFYNNSFNEIVMNSRANTVVTNWLAHISQKKIKVAMPGCLPATWPRNLASVKGLRSKLSAPSARFRGQVAGRQRGMATLIFFWEMCASQFVTTVFSLVIITISLILLLNFLK